MEKIINLLIKEFIEGADTYTHNGSTWLIFTESKKWVIELTKEKTLWYNYTFFKEIFEYTSMDVVDNQHYITKWVEDNIINGSNNTPSPSQTPSYNLVEVLENGVKNTDYWGDKRILSVEDTLGNGVKEIKSDDFNVSQHLCEEVIDNGVKKTKGFTMRTDWSIEDTIENGVRHTARNNACADWEIENTIQNGVRHTEIGWHQINNVDDTIEKGVKETNHVDVMKFFDNKMEETLQNGVKETNPWNDSIIGDLNQNGCIDNVIENGVKKISPLDPEFSVRFIDGNRDNDWELVPNINEVIDNGVKETHDDVYHHKGRIDGVIKNGVKETKTSGDGNLLSTLQWMEENKANSVPKMIDDVIENGVKETKVSDYCGNNAEYFITDQYLIDRVLDNGVKISGTFVGGKRQKENIESVIDYGTKNPTD
jgi:predicted peroxiredoxin